MYHLAFAQPQEAILETLLGFGVCAIDAVRREGGAGRDLEVLGAADVLVEDCMRSLLDEDVPELRPALRRHQGAQAYILALPPFPSSAPRRRA